MDIRHWIKHARQNAKPAPLTQGELGEALGVSKQNVSAWENGHHEPSYSQILKIRQITKAEKLPHESQPPGLHMPMVDRPRYQALSEVDQAYVQAKAMAAIEEREAAAAAAARRKPSVAA